MNSKKTGLPPWSAIGYMIVSLFFCCCATVKQGPIVNPSQVKHHDEVRVRRLGGDINTTEDDFAFIITSKNATPFLTSDRSGGSGRQDIYRVVAPGVNPENLNLARVSNLTDLNTSENEGTATFTPDGHTMIFAAAGRSDCLGSSDLYQADLINGHWGNVRNLTALNSSNWDSHPSLSSDGRTLYFVSDRAGGFGGQDIYVATKVGDNWTAPQNLGPQINTASHEASPFIAADGKTLYFSSMGHPGLGGYDVFVSRNVGGVWSKPENAGVPINTPADDMFYTAELGTEHAFLSSNRDSSLGGLDVFSVEPNPFASGGVTTVHGYVRDIQTKKPLSAAVTITDLQSGDKVAEFRTNDSTGEYFVVLQPGQTYSITAESEGYLFYSDQYQVLDLKDIALQHDIYLSPTLTGKTRLLIFFDFNMASLKKESFPELNRVVTLMKNSPAMRIQLSGYTDSIGKAEYNQVLSESRAKSAKLYLVEHGISGNRISTFGGGESNPIATNTTEEGRALNRRVEMQIVR